MPSPHTPRSPQAVTDEPLRYPAHFPPAGWWKKFFMGVRWLGPDTAFLKEFRARQAARTADTELQWEEDRRVLAAMVGSAFSTCCRWPTRYFLPGDSVEVVANGTNLFWPDSLDVREAIWAIEEEVGLELGAAFWAQARTGSMGELVDRLLAAQGPR